MEPIVAIGVLTITSVAIVVIVTNDTTVIGVIDDFLLLPVMKLWWDAECAL
ncbi:MAG: hypothetical protein J1F37_06665 [Oscillospiraceae bacterium]|nr:hypothetical protein [Oscillospiraceae bacterium]